MKKTYHKNPKVTLIYVALGSLAYIAIILKGNAPQPHLVGTLFSIPIFLALLLPFLLVRIVKTESMITYYNPIPRRILIKDIREMRAYGELSISRMAGEVDQIDIIHDGNSRMLGINAWLFDPKTLGEFSRDLLRQNPRVVVNEGITVLMKQAVVTTKEAEATQKNES